MRKMAIALLWTAMLLPWLTGDVVAATLRCSFDASNINFGNIDVLTGASHSSSGSVQVDCTGDPFQHVTICPNLGSGTGNPTGYDPRQLKKWGDSSLKLNFNIYWPSSPDIWGSLLWPYPPQPPIWHLQLDATGELSTTYTMPAVVFGGQQAARPGVYSSRFRRQHIAFQYKAGTHTDCGGGKTKRPGFRVRARVIKSCLVSATDLDFGAVGNLNANVDATATITVQCSNGTDYKIRIDGGHTGTTNPANRKMTDGSHEITYGIYRDAARTQGWGRWNSNDVNATGTGYQQTFTAYGRVPPQPTPPPGTYTDTLVVSVVY